MKPPETGTLASWAGSVVAVPLAKAERPVVRGKFLFVGDEKLWVRGVTYGTFRPQGGSEYPPDDVVERDFVRMAANGINAVRTYTPPPRRLLELAHRFGLRVMVGLPWEQHVAFLNERSRARDIVRRVRMAVAEIAGHPAILCYAVGNEIPAPVVRWHGRQAIERFLHRLYRAVKSEDPGSLVTYVNYPSTEYLELPFLDLVCFNVYLEDRERLEGYLARLQNLAGDRPLVMAELGLDSRRHGEAQQARTLRWQLASAFAAGCAGAFVFAWTDEWHRGGHDVDDWDFGLTDRDGGMKPALAAVRDAFAATPYPPDVAWPRVSVVVCSYNGARTIRDTMDGLARLNYPDYEVIVVDDGSTDATAAIARGYDVRLISTPNRGLSNARNTGLEAATGEIVAYIDDDAWPDPDWLTYLAATFRATPHVAVGGPNLPPPGDGAIAACVANSPGGPNHVLLSDREAEHIPGCNMAFRRDALSAIGGFDPRFRVAGDDVDVCWRLQARGGTLGFHAAAVVWHHRRNSVRAYWRQQRGYGRAESLLEGKWPEKYNAAGHIAWSGRIYGPGLPWLLAHGAGRIYQGVWGTAPFQSVYRTAPSTLLALALMPEWYLVVLALAGAAALGLAWPPLLAVAAPLLVITIGASLVQALLGAWRAPFFRASRARRGALRILTALLHLMQPVARLRGRLHYGLTPWRRRGEAGVTWPSRRVAPVWRERWLAPWTALERVEEALREARLPVRRGGDFDGWDLHVAGGLVGAARLLMVAEEHGTGRQLFRFRIAPRLPTTVVVVAAALGALAGVAAGAGSVVVAAVAGLALAALTLRALVECGTATTAIRRIARRVAADEPAA